MTDYRHIGDPPDHSVAVDALAPAARTVPLPVIEQVAEHHRGLADDSGVGDRHAEFDGAHDRVGNNGFMQVLGVAELNFALTRVEPVLREQADHRLAASTGLIERLLPPLP